MDAKWQWFIAAVVPLSLWPALPVPLPARRRCRLPYLSWPHLPLTVCCSDEASRARSYDNDTSSRDVSIILVGDQWDDASGVERPRSDANS